MINKRSIDLEAASNIGAIVKGSLKRGRALSKAKKPATSKFAKPAKEPAATNKYVPVSKNPSMAKVDPRTTGENPTHKRSADTGKVSKLTSKQRADIDKYSSNRQFNKIASSPSVDLRDII
jgi:hypothetical protein